MGTTLTALQTTSGITYQTVVAIEGFEYLLTDGSTTEAVNAWSSSDDYIFALGGLFVEMQRQSDWDPFNAFTDGGTLTLTVAPDALDILGKQIGRTNAGAATQLDATLDCDDTTITVKTTSGFPSSGSAFIGTECFGYSGKTATTFTGVTRGMYSPFLTNTGTGRFAHQHRSGPVSTYQTSLQPVVSQYRRSWKGASVGVWIHRVVNGVLDIKAQAQLVFAGTVEELYDAGETGHTVIVCKDVQDRIKGASLMRDVFRARISEGMQIAVGATIEFREATLGATVTTASPLVCVAGAPANHKEFRAGVYTVTELCGVITHWLAGEPATTQNAYTLESPVIFNGKMRTVMTWEQEIIRTWKLKVPADIACFLGLTESIQGAAPFEWSGLDLLALNQSTRQGSDWSPYRWLMANGTSMRLTDVQGVFVDQYALMPFHLRDSWLNSVFNAIKPPTSLGLEWGVFTLNGEPYLSGAIEESGGVYSITHIRRFISEDIEETLAIRYASDSNAPNVELSQIFAIRAPFRDILMWLFASTGTVGFNHATYDALPYALSLGVPWELLGSAFEASVMNMPEGEREMTLMITEPISLEKLFNVDLVLRGLHLVWRNQGLIFRRWSTPVAGGGGAGTPTALTESNKAMPSGTKGTHRTTTKITSQWLTPIVSIVFDRDWRQDKYKDGPLILEDRVSIDDLGGDAPTKKLEARNMIRADVEAIAPLFLEMAQFFSRPAYIYQRSMSQQLFETLAPGDIVTVTDAFARDPVTGARGMSAVPGLLVKHGYSPGGPDPGDPASGASSQVGTVEVLVFPFDRPSVYSPSGEIDPTADGGGFTKGYNSGTNTIRLKAHAYTPSTANADASYFATGDKVEITKVDPDIPASPQTWDTTVVSVSGNDLVINTTLTGYNVIGSTSYRVRAQPYNDATTAQRANVFEADDADNQILDLVGAFTYGLPSNGVPSHSTELAPWPAELIPELVYGDGVAHDTATDVQLARALNNLMSHKSAHNMPMLRSPSAMGHTTASTRRILAIMPVCFGPMKPTATVRRYVSVAPFARSGTGISTTITVTLVGSYPTATSYDNQTHAEPNSAATFTTSSTTWGTPAAVDLDLSVLSADGVGFLIIEGTDRAETYGLAQVSETEL